MKSRAAQSGVADVQDTVDSSENEENVNQLQEDKGDKSLPFYGIGALPEWSRADTPEPFHSHQASYASVFDRCQCPSCQGAERSADREFDGCVVRPGKKPLTPQRISLAVSRDSALVHGALF